MFGSTTSGGESNSQQLSGNQAVWPPSIIAEATSQAVLTPPPSLSEGEQESYGRVVTGGHIDPSPQWF